METDVKPYSGVRILDATQVFAGPLATYLLALQGAEVIRVDRADGPDISRRSLTNKALDRAEMGEAFLFLNANKRSIALDLKHPEGTKAFRRLARDADVVVENFRPGVMKRLGLNYEAIRRINPRVVYCSVSGFGQDGSLSRRPAFDHAVQAMSGLMWLNRDAGGTPTRVGAPIVDYVTGIVAAFAIASAIRLREVTGRSQLVDVSMLEATLTLLGPMIAPIVICGMERPLVSGSAFSGSPFSGTFATADGALALVANTPEQAGRVAYALGLEDLAQNREALATRGAGPLTEMVQERLRVAFLARTAAEWETIMDEAGVPAARVQTLTEAVGHAHVRDRKFFIPLGGLEELGRTVAVPGPGFILNSVPLSRVQPPPRRGEHTESILLGAGYRPAAVQKLFASGAAWMPPAEAAA